MAIKRGISLYSYQQSYYLGKLDLEGCVAAAAATGAKGIELIPEQMPVGRFPDPSPDHIAWWKDLMAKYEVEPTCMDSFIDFKLYASRKRNLTLQEQVKMMERDLKLASELGFKVIRVLCKIHADVIEASLPIAEYYGVKMGREIHPPVMIDSPYMDDYVEMIQKHNTKWAVLIPDFGVFCQFPCNSLIEQFIRGGLNSEIAWFVQQQIKNRRPIAETRAKIIEMGATQRELDFINSWNCLPTYNEPEKLIPLMQYVEHFHGKCYELDEDCNESTIDYPGVINVLKQADWDGYISTEYEGQRNFHDESCESTADDIEQVCRHQMLLKRLIEA